MTTPLSPLLNHRAVLAAAELRAPLAPGVPSAQPRLLSSARRAWRALAPRLVSWPFPLLVLLLWYLGCRFEWIAPQVLPSPATVWATLVDMFRSGDIWLHLQVSLVRVFAGFALGLAAGGALGIAMGLSPTFKDYVYPLFKAFSQVPVLGWLPLLMLLVGIDETLKIVLIAKAALVPVALNTYKGIQGVPTRYIEVARVLRFTRWQLLTKVVLPAAFAPIWNGVRYGFTHAWLALVVVELLASSEGIGYLIVYGRQLFQLDVVLAAVVVVGAVGFALDKALALIEVRLTRWRRAGF